MLNLKTDSIMYAGLMNPHKGNGGKEYLYSVETDDKKFTPVYRENLEPKNGHHNWWYQLMIKGENTKTGFHDKNGKEIRLNDILIVPSYDIKGVHEHWDVVVATKPKKWTRFEKEGVVFKQIHLGWEYHLKIGMPDKIRETFTAYTDECISIGKLSDIVKPDGYLTNYEKDIKTPDDKKVF